MNFWPALLSERRKLIKRKKYKVFFLILAAAYFIGSVITDKTGYAAGGLVMGDFLFYFYLPFIAFLGVNDLIASEIRDKSIKECIVCPVSRMQIYLAKCLSVFFMCALHAIAVVALDYLMGCAHLMRGSVYEIAYVLMDLVPLFTLIAFAALVSVTVKSPAFSMLITLAAYAFLTVGSMYFGVTPALFTGYLTWHTLLHGGVGFAGMLERVIAVVSPLVLFLSAGAIVLERKRF